MFSFLALPFLWFATAALIPLALHLFQRRKKVTVRFSTVRFLKLAQRRSSSRVRMENFLLWLLRTAILLLLAFAFALPVLRRKDLGGLLGQSKRIVGLVWDAGFSMGYQSGGRNVWQDAQEAAAAVMGGLKDGDQVCLFLAGEEPVALIEQPTKDLAFALATVRAQQPRATSSRLQPAVAAALRAMKTAGSAEKELYILTDGQARPWTSFAESAGEEGKIEDSVRVFLASLGAAAPENTAPSRVEVQPSLLIAGRPVRLKTEVVGSGAPRTVSLSLFVDDQLAGRRDTTAGDATAEPAVFNLPALPAGPHAARVDVGEDGLAIDDTYHFLLSAAERLRVPVIGEADATFFLRRALRPSEDLTLFDVQAVTPAESPSMSLEGSACIILADAIPLPGQTFEKIEAYVNAGGTLLVFPGDRATAADYTSWTLLPSPVTGSREFPAGTGRRNLRLTAPRDPLFTTLRLPPGSVPSIAFKRALSLGDPNPGSEVLLSAGEDLPFLLRRKVGNGQVLAFTGSADRGWTDFPITPVFLPVLHQIVLSGAGGLNREPSHTVSDRLVFADRSGRVREGSVIKTPDGESRTVRALREEGQSGWMIEDATVPGIYTLEDGAAMVPVLAVNVPREESNLESIEAAAMGERLGRKGLEVARDRTELLRQIEEHRVGRPLGEASLWLALVLAAAEVAWANRISRRTNPLSSTLKVDDSGRVREAA